MSKTTYQIAWSPADEKSRIEHFDCEATSATSAITKTRTYLRETHGYETGKYYVIREVYVI